KLGEYKRTAEYRVLRSGQTSPFEILYLDQQTSERVANFTPSATAMPLNETREPSLRILSSNSRLDVLGTLYINSLARNEGNETSTNTLLVATLFDKDDRVVAIGRAQAEAVPGTADIPIGSDAAFGVVVTDKLQTYKTDRYSLLAQSDQYTSDEVMFKTSGGSSSTTSTTTPGGNQTQSGCLIATAAFGSEFAPQVQQLRDFRDGIAMRTFAGSSFMAAFNAWYYSFSPSVAAYERESPWAQQVVRVTIQPLLLILDASSSLNGSLSSLGIDGEPGIVATGMLASSLIGAVYLSPAAVLIGAKRKRLFDSRKLRWVLAFSWALSAALIAAGAALESGGTMAVGTSMLVLCCISSAVLLVSDRVSRL
ncbi:MAG TPA: CFI-box-CTERM domain-containing protein, partial [Nitrososphaera sp.]|nr:CFI-box-CTERM domain-containing protein [Nitrososphaera sp.]